MKLLAFGILALATCSRAVNLKLKVHPEPDDPKSKLIWFNRTTAAIWSQKLDNYLEPYRMQELDSDKETHKVCDHDNPITKDTVCLLETEHFNPCVVTNYFGYKALNPCIFIELEKIRDWKPSFYNDTTSLPKKMPKSLKAHIDEVTQDPNMWDTVWISCEGDAPADKEFIGVVKYLPHRGYPGYLFPYTGQESYSNPILAVQFTHPKVGVVVNITCKLWGPGITQDEKNSIGVAHFEMLIDEKD